MNELTERKDILKKLEEIISGLRTAIVTTIDNQGHLHNEPLVVAERKFDGELWFLIRKDSEFTEPLRKATVANVVLACQKSQQYACFTGAPTVHDDFRKTESLRDE